MHRTLLASGVLALLLALPRVAQAQEPPTVSRAGTAGGDTITLSLAEAQRLALTRDPAFLAQRQEAEIARGELTQARVYTFNPELEFEAADAGTNRRLGEYEASLTQEIEYAGQRGLRVDAARIGLNRTELNVQNAARATLAEASTAFYAALAADQRLQLAGTVLELNQRLLEATRVQLQEGEISVLEANLAEIEFGRARARVLTAEREATSARLTLKRRAGLAPEQPIRLTAEVPDALDPFELDRDALTALALEQRPDLASYSAAVQQFRTLQRLARREALPNLRVGVLAERTMDPVLALDGAGNPRLRQSLTNEPVFGLGVSVAIPLWNRNQGLRAERAARTEQATLRRAAAELEVRTEVANSYRAYLAATEEVEVFERDVLRPARENQGLLETAYREGKIDLANLILLRNQLLEAELGYWDAWLAQREALVELEAATATIRIPDVASSR